jgi:O-antigen ligase
MFRDHPLGVGPGNFNQYIGRYTSTTGELSAHSIYIQTLAELGWPGMLVLLALLGNGLWTVRNVIRISGHLSEPERSILQWSSCGLGAVIVSYATAGITANILYFEGLYWFLLLPVCLQRASENAHEALLANNP